VTAPEAAAMMTVVLSGGLLLYPIFRGLGRRLEGRPDAGAIGATSDSAKRLERMEHAIEAMAVEVERISEGQRFVTKLLAEREREPLRIPAESR
jgi:hypothetical protein